MAEKGAPQESEGPSLELPSFGFRRKKKRAPEKPPAPAHQPAEEPLPAPAAEPDRAVPEPAPQPEPEPEPVPEPEPAPVAREDAAPTPQPTPVATEEPAAPSRAGPTLPQLGATPAALVTGLVVGAVTVGLVWASQQGCELLRGTSSCGNAGFLLLLAVLVAAAWLGGALLRGFGVDDGGSTSFLAMGLVAVVLMLFLADVLFAWWMVLVVPVVAMLAYWVSHRVTTAMVEPGGPEMHR